ncbi:MAG: tRNA pseudouridine(13) synthase TruD [Gammaproteobacteria bacterium]|nr:tRNA pseudouridine(13) synthase TruD [Gammaproteobacteria bacterium]
MKEWARLLDKPMQKAVLRCQPADFQVDEVLGFEPSGEGEHWFLQLEKTALNSDEVAKRVADLAQVKLMDVGYSGLKDRNAITRQWFSVYLPGQPAPDWQSLNSENVSVLQVTQHSKKLRRGVHKANRFEITLREFEGEFNELKNRLGFLQKNGFANYFGEQRFGHGGRNVEHALALFERRLRKVSRAKKSIYLSAARSWLFNCVLSERINQGRWSQLQQGDVVMLHGSHSIFAIEAVDELLQQRLAEGDIHLTGPMWGKGCSKLGEEAYAWEKACIVSEPPLTVGLEAAGMKMERRPLRVFIKGVELTELEADVVRLAFELPTGSYATSLLRELLNYRQ